MYNTEWINNYELICIVDWFNDNHTFKKKKMKNIGLNRRNCKSNLKIFIVKVCSNIFIYYSVIIQELYYRMKKYIIETYYRMKT